MRTLWQAWAARIDALSERERLVVLVALLGATAFLFHLILLQPVMAQNRQLVQRAQSQAQELQEIQRRIEAFSRGEAASPDRLRRERLFALQRELEALEASLQNRQSHLVPAERIARLLREVLERNRGLQLVSLMTLPPVDLADPNPAQGTAENPLRLQAQGGEGPQRLYRHGVEISVRGSYSDLLRYVTELERLPWRMYWGRLQLAVDKYPVSTLTLTVYTLSMERTWLVI
jgi:MSHA biogenesis protein MshJ